MTSDVTTGRLGSAPMSATRSADPARTVPMWRTALVACVAAAVATTAIAAAARSAGVAVEIDDQPIPLLGFTQLTLLFSAIGVLLAAALRRWAPAPKRTFLAVTGVLLALSVVPDLLVSATTGTRLTLIATHLVAAAIVVPLVAGRLPARTR
ncbi:DUF6069 family protein [Actinomadura sp. B10D3]|uniref:DUF6069 family protein n=1 Tax=Actinomadura sp. B10D3 TaxID=3153557 RepID=UPI00325C6A0C